MLCHNRSCWFLTDFFLRLLFERPFLMSLSQIEFENLMYAGVPMKICEFEKSSLNFLKIEVSNISIRLQSVLMLVGSTWRAPLPRWEKLWICQNIQMHWMPQRSPPSTAFWLTSPTPTRTLLLQPWTTCSSTTWIRCEVMSHTQASVGLLNMDCNPIWWIRLWVTIQSQNRIFTIVLSGN